MSLRTLLRAVLVTLSLSPFWLASVYSQGQGQYTVTMPYEAPIRPGMPAWRNVPASEHLKILDIPVAVATNMTTDALVWSCLNHPWGPVCFAFNDPQMGVSRLFTNFYGFTELRKRADAGQCLVAAYKRLTTDREQQTNDNPLLLMYVHPLFQKPEIESLFSQEQFKELAMLSLRNCVSIRRKEKALSGTEVETARFALRLIITKGVVLSAGTSRVDRASLPTGAERFVNRRPVASDFTDQVQALALAVTRGESQKNL